ncbi:hypothetical protein BV133_2239 [Blastochloris viridis]|nr:hypothetical protein BV133_2239 [Blastochloris viridis]
MDAGAYLGMSAETVFRVYGHHNPAGLAGIRDVFDRPGKGQKP